MGANLTSSNTQKLHSYFECSRSCDSYELWDCFESSSFESWSIRLKTQLQMTQSTLLLTQESFWHTLSCLPTGWVRYSISLETSSTHKERTPGSLSMASKIEVLQTDTSFQYTTRSQRWLRLGLETSTQSHLKKCYSESGFKWWLVGSSPLSLGQSEQLWTEHPCWAQSTSSCHSISASSC